MKTLLALTIAITFAYCGPPRLTNTGEPTATTRFNSGASPTINKTGTMDTVAVTGTEYLQVLGRNENGMYPALEGQWELQAVTTGNLANANNLIKETEAQKNEGKPFTAQVPAPHLEGSKEVKRESNTTQSISGTTTTTTIYLVNDKDEKQITPPQGTQYHVPAKPNISLFGSNETFSGFTGCNKFAGRYTLGANNSITFRHSAPSTRMVCIGDYNENVFLESLKKVTHYKSTGAELQLFDGDKLVFIFARK